tara:strand:- start:2786 stop:3445 length:660 start_codon:yes stop_codon:yes gene_type:complete
MDLGWRLTYAGQKWRGNFADGVNLTNQNNDTVRMRNVEGKKKPVLAAGVRALDPEHIKLLQYWIPTITSRLGQHAEMFCRSYRETPVPEGTDAFPIKDGGNSYWLNGQGLWVPVGDEFVTISLGDENTVEEHFRHSYMRRIPNQDRMVKVTGTFVCTDWEDKSLDTVCAAIEAHAWDIKQNHFADVILPSMVLAGHDEEMLLQAFMDNYEMAAEFPKTL